MKKHALRTAAPAGALSAALVLGALLAGGAGATSGAGEAQAAKCSKATTTKLDDVGFSPSSLCVRRGTKLTWKALKTNLDVHDVSVARAASSPGVPYFKSGDLVPGDSYRSRKLPRGSYLFVCTYHQQMTQQVTVK